ncbi:TPA: hypothetical protein HA231_05975 [Candidatus Woesearchaeota archaeon]|nr:hypothetical protein [Candidatus Woesearchaeota archaeon]
MCDCDDAWDCTYDLLDGDKDYCCPSGQKWDGSKCATPCKDGDGDGHKDSSCGGDDCNDGDSSVWKKNSCNICAKEPPGLGDSCEVGTGECKRTGTKVCDISGTGTKCSATPGSPSTEVCDDKDNDCDGATDEGGVCCKDNDGDGYGSPGSPSCPGGGSTDCNDNDAGINPGKAENCSDGKDNDCDEKTDGADTNCCNPPGFFCTKADGCFPTKEQCDTSLFCEGGWWACNNPSSIENCVDNTFGCCPPDYPYYCAKTVDWCTKNADVCSKLKKCGDTWSYCQSADAPHWNCKADGKSHCCQSGVPYWWESDKQCHASPYTPPPPCPVPDGKSAFCECDKDSECEAADPARPYCGDGGNKYDIRTPQGYHACLPEKPEYCGNGKCTAGKGENYKNCPTDCAGTAPKGRINVEVVYYGGGLKDKPIQGAQVYLDEASKGVTDSTGRIAFDALHGSRVVKVTCPDAIFCDSITKEVDGEELAHVRCTCNPPGDMDGDGYSDEDEKLLGTDPKAAGSNFGTTFKSDSVDLTACLVPLASFLIVWKEVQKGKSIIESHNAILNAVNVTSVTTVSFTESPHVMADAMAKAGIQEQAEVLTSTNVTLEDAMKRSEYVGGFFTQKEFIIVATDKDTGTTALISIGAGCIGAYAGAAYGIGQGLFDDVAGILEGIWFVITHANEVGKIVDAAKDLIIGIVELIKKPGELAATLFRNTLDKGRGINAFREDRLNKPEEYRRFQVGFTYGFATGYLTEQVVLGSIIFAKVASAFKLGQLFGKIGKAAKLTEKLAAIRATEGLGAEIAEKMSKLKYFKEGIDGWLDSEIKGLARIVKHNENWAKGLTEAEAKLAAKNAENLISAGKATDGQIGELLKTNLGRNTLKASDATEDLLSKQAKLVEKLGASKIDELTKKNWWDVFSPDRIAGLSKILKTMPEGVMEKFDAQKIASFLGDKNIIKGAEELAKSVDPATLAKIAGNLDEFENLAKAAGRIANKYGSVDEFYKSLKLCVGLAGVTAAAVCSPEKLQEIAGTLKNFGQSVTDITLDGIRKRVIDFTEIPAEKLARFIKGFGKNPFDLEKASEVAREQELVKMLKAPGKRTIIGSETIDGVFVLRKGRKVDAESIKEWGIDHIKYKHIEHDEKFKNAFGKTLDDEDIKKIAEKVIDGGTPVKSTHEGIKEAVEKTITYEGKEAKVRVVYFIKKFEGAIPGDIATVFIP